LQYLVECKPDMVLIKVLVKRSKVIHAGNKSELLKHLIKYSENSVGVID